MTLLPDYNLFEAKRRTEVDLRFMGDASGIAAAERAVEQWIDEGEGTEFQIFLGPRLVESGSVNEYGEIAWATNGRRSDLR